MSNNPCPYCDHPNPPESKFCSACGAAMHLAPCKNCGAVNDKSAAKCYRCHQPFSFGKENVAALAAPVQSEIKEQTIDAEVVPDAPSVKPTKADRPPIIAIAMVLIAFAVATFYAYRQRSVIVPVHTAPVAPAVTNPIKTAPEAVKPAVVDSTNAGKPSAAGTASESAPALAPVVTRSEAAPLSAAAPETSANSTKAPKQVARPSESRPARSKAGDIRIEKTNPPAQPCTEAIAALGLCTLDSNQRKP